MSVEDRAGSLVAAFLLEAEAYQALAKAARMRAEVASLAVRETDELLDVTRARAEFGVGRDGLKNAADRGEITLSRGARGKLWVTRTELRRWLDSRPYKSSKATPVTDDVDAIEEELKRGTLVRTNK